MGITENTIEAFAMELPAKPGLSKPAISLLPIGRNMAVSLGFGENRPFHFGRIGRKMVDSPGFIENRPKCFGRPTEIRPGNGRIVNFGNADCRDRRR